MRTTKRVFSDLVLITGPIPQCTADNVEASLENETARLSGMHKEMPDSFIKEKLSFWKAIFVTTLLRVAHIFRRGGAEQIVHTDNQFSQFLSDLPRQ